MIEMAKQIEKKRNSINLLPADERVVAMQTSIMNLKRNAPHPDSFSGCLPFTNLSRKK